MWSKEIAIQRSTAAQPSNHIVVKLVCWKLREKPQKIVSNLQQGQGQGQGGGISVTGQLLQTFLL
jgi:hypothetical protein